MRWGSSIGGAVGGLVAGPAGALAGHLVGGVAGKMLEDHVKDLAPDAISSVVGLAVDLTIGEEAGDRIHKLGQKLVEGRTPQEQHEIRDALQAALRDAFVEAVYDAGGPRCFPAVWKGPRKDAPAPHAFAETDGRALWSGSGDPDPLAGQVCDLLTALATDALAGHLFAAQPGDGAATDARRYLQSDTPDALAGAFFDQLVAPHLQPYGALLADLRARHIDLEGYLRRTLLDRTLVYLGQQVTQHDAAWRAFNRLLLDGLRATLSQLVAGQATLQQSQQDMAHRLDALLAGYPASGDLPAWSADMAMRLTNIGFELDSSAGTSSSAWTTCSTALPPRAIPWIPSTTQPCAPSARWIR